MNNVEAVGIFNEEIRKIVNEELDKRIGTEKRYHVNESYPDWYIYDRGMGKVVGVFKEREIADHICNLLDNDLQNLNEQIEIEEVHIPEKLREIREIIELLIDNNYYPTVVEKNEILSEICKIEDALNCQTQL